MSIWFVGLGVVAAFVLLFVRIVPRNVRIVDGDTIKVKGVSWRLTGFDAPEWNQPGGRDATKAITRILRAAPAIAFVWSRDVYGRPLATILTIGGPLSWRMTLAGHGHGEGLMPRLLTLVAYLLRRGLWSRRGQWLGRGGIVTPRQWRDGWR